jgi:hypothetical protein
VRTVSYCRLALLLVPVLACGSPSAATDAGASSDRDAGTTSTAVPIPGVSVPACVSSRASLAFATSACATKSPDALDASLALLGRDRCTLGVSPDALALSKLDARDPRILDAWRGAQATPLAMPGWARATSDALDAAMASRTPVTQAIVSASALREAPITVCPDASAYELPPGAPPLALALAELRQQALAASEVEGVPLELQRALVPIVRAIASANATIAASYHLDAAAVHTVSVVPSWLLGVRHFEWSADTDKTFESVDVTLITRAAAGVALAVEGADLRRFAGLAVPAKDLATPLGAIVLRGPGNDTWTSADDDAPALLLDTGGDDTYEGPIAAGTSTRRVSVAIDLGGHDTYGYRAQRVAADAHGARLPSDGAGRAPDGRTLSRVGRQGSGVFGVGLLFDLGDSPDSYRSLIASQGAGTHGVGVLYDAGGDDSYEAEGFSQGAGAWGIGLLLDDAGDDHHVLYQAGQGYGFARGVGILLDRTGADVYVANSGEPSLGGDLLYPSDQLPGPPASSVSANHSFAQGCGAGHRPDWPDAGHPFPGGIGLLRDASGDDRYMAGVFAQGVGFVQGVGMLLDGAGDDQYDALYYAQGAGVHQGVALLTDRNGSDRYDLTFPNQGASLGMANDLSVAIVFDQNGDDQVRASALSLGSGLANGVAVFAFDGGEDAFRASSADGFGGASMGDVSGARKDAPTLGIFVKARGHGKYTAGDAKDGRHDATWHEHDSGADQGPARSVGVDAPTGRVQL